MNPKSMCSCWWQWNSVMPGIVSNEINLGFLITAEHDNILDDATGLLSPDASQFKAVPVQMDGWMSSLSLRKRKR